MSFRAGQRVRAIATTQPGVNEQYVGAIGTIMDSSTRMNHCQGHGVIAYQSVRWEEGPLPDWARGRTMDEPVKCLAPIDEPNLFERFMARVLKPVKLPKEINA
jgi:hypothetical protein